MMLKTAQVAALVWLQLSLSWVGTGAQAAEPQELTVAIKHLVVIFQENHSDFSDAWFR